MKKHDTYKETNSVEIQVIPASWGIIKIKNPDFFDIQSSGIDEFKGTKEYLSTESISGIKLDHTEETITFNKRPARANLQPKEDYIYFAKMKDTLKMILPDKDFCEKYIISTGFAGLFSKKINSAFIKYIILSHYFNSKKDMLSQGTTQEAINNRWIREISIPVPPPEEQLAIVNFLEEKTKKIDRIIQNKKRQIELMKEQEFNLIKKTVTGGISDVNLKKTGIFWIDEINKEWKKSKVKYYCSTFIPQRDKPDLNQKEDGFPWITMDDIGKREVNKSNSDFYVNEKIAQENGSRTLKPFSVIASCVGNFGVSSVNTSEVIINQQLQAYVPKDINPYFLRYFVIIARPYYESVATATTIVYVNQRRFENMPICIPKIKEQERIVDYIDSNLNKYEQVNRILIYQIQKLEEYKKILINEAVTGKIKVTA